MSILSSFELVSAILIKDYSARSFSSSLFEVAPLREDGSPHAISLKEKGGDWSVCVERKGREGLEAFEEETGLSLYEGKLIY